MTPGQYVARILSASSYVFSTERELQQAVSDVLTLDFKEQVEREAVLSPRDRPDFMVTAFGKRIAVEVKIKGSRNAILRQVGRYCEHDTVDAVVLAASKRQILAGFPAEIHGKPVAVALLAGDL